VGIFLCRQHLIIPKTVRYAREMMSYGVPFMVVAVAGCIMPAIDRVFIVNYLGLDSAGLYAIGYRYGFLLMLPITAFMTSWSPFAFSIYREDDAEETYSRGLKFMVAGLCAITIVMVALAEPVITLVASERYLPVYVVVLPLLLRLIIQAISSVASLGIRLAKRTQFQMAGYLIGLVASAFFVWILIEPLGLIGVACGALLRQLAHSASEIAFSYRVYPLRFELKRPLAMLVITAIGGATIQLVVMPDLQQEIALRVVVLAAVAGLLWLVTFRAGGTPDQSTGSA
jgi:O-antigen/teichoic acid export membrane protein